MIILVEDNLNTHNGTSLYETVPPEEARRRVDRLEFHSTPKHGSWLDMAETELGILDRQCLDRRIDSQDELLWHLWALAGLRNTIGSRIVAVGGPSGWRMSSAA